MKDRSGSVGSVGMERPMGFVGGMPVRRHGTARSGMIEGSDRRGALGCGRVRVNRSWVC